MADTSRTLSALQTLLADNTAGAISPQDLRDMLLSLSSGYGMIYVQGGSTAQGSLSGTPAKLTAFAGNGVSSDTTPDHTDDSIAIGTAGKYLCSFHCSFTGTGSSTFQFRIAIDGVESVIGFERAFPAAPNYGSASCAGVLSLAAAEKVTVYVSSDDGGTSVTVSDAQLTVSRIE